MAGRLATGALAIRGAGSPDAFAAFLAGRARGGSPVIGLAMDGGQLQCPNCGYRSDDADFKVTQGSTADTSDPAMPEELRTPAPGTGAVRDGVPLTPSRGSVGAPGLSNPSDGAISLAAPRYPVTTADDVLVTRSASGGAQIRHRRGGTLIGEIVNDNGWKAVYGGRQLTPRTHQRAALADLIGNWNHGTTTMEHPADGQLQPPPQQTPLMAQYGIPAIRALANGYSSDSGSSDSDNDNDNDNGSGGLTPKGQGIFKKLKAKGWPDAKAMMFAKRAQSFGGAK